MKPYPYAASSKSEVLTMLEEGRTGDVKTMLLTLARIHGENRVTGKVFQEVTNLVLGPDPEVGGRAAFVLSMVAEEVDLSSHALGVMRTLEEAIATKDTTIAQYSVTALGICLAGNRELPVRSETIDSIIGLFAHPGKFVRMEACWALIRISARDSTVMEKLEALEQDQKMAGLVKQLETALMEHFRERMPAAKHIDDILARARELEILQDSPKETIVGSVNFALENIRKQNMRA